MAINKTLMVLVGLLCLVSTANASIMLEKWIDLFDNMSIDNPSESNMDKFIKVIIWQFYSTLGPLLSGLVYTAVYELYEGFSDDVKYGACAANICNFEDLFAYFMNYILYTLIIDELLGPILGISYTADEFSELDLDSFSTVAA